MTVEERLFVRLPEDLTSRVSSLARRSAEARVRAKKAPPGDRSDVVPFEQFQTEIEGLALKAWAAGAVAVREDTGPSGQDRFCLVTLDSFPEDVSGHVEDKLREWLSSGSAIVECVVPFGQGPTSLPEGPGFARPPKEMWEDPDGHRGRRAVKSRFEEQLARAVKRQSGAEIRPSGISNVVLTNALWTYVNKDVGDLPVEIPVVYSDGTSARKFPLRSLALVDDPSARGRVLDFTLLSMRHMQTDSNVAGAWLRNVEISRQRPRADTDELVYSLSLSQLTRLVDRGPTTVVMHQTGLETAVVGFYRAVVEVLRLRPHELVVVPAFYQQDGSPEYGRAWRVS